MATTDIPARAETRSIVTEMAHKFGMERAAFEQTLMKTVMPSESATREQVAAFLAVAREYDLNMFTKEIFAFPTQAGGIQPVVSVDGWLKIINSHSQCNGFELVENFVEGKIESVTCIMHRKDREHPVVITEHLNECIRSTKQWEQKPIRMLRHKALIQAARYAFGFSGIVDPDEAERMIEMGEADVSERANTASATKVNALREKLSAAKESPVIEATEDDGEKVID